MRIPGFVALSLLSARELIGSDGAVFKADPKRFQRMLQRVESATGPGAGSRQLKGGDGKNKGGVRVLKEKDKGKNNGGARATDDSGKKKKGGKNEDKGDKAGARTKDSKTSKTGLNDNGRDSNGALHSAHLDNNVNGIESVPEGIVEYAYGEQISMTIEMNNELVPEDIRKGLDLSKKDEWLIGVYMRMEDVNSNEPIVTAIPSITCEEVAATERKLQDANATEAPPQDEGEGSNVDAEPETPEGPDDPEPVDLLCTGTANVTDTGKDTLNRKEYGDGLDFYVIDGDGKKISGPMTVYMMQSEEDIEAEDAEAKSQPNHPLAKFNHAAKKKKAKDAKSGKKEAADAGEGTGMDGKAIISTTQGLADYWLDVTSETGLYVKGDVVTVDYDLNPAAEEERRRLQGNSGGNGNGNGPPAPEEEEEETTTEATDPASADGTPSPEEDVTTTGPTEPEVDMGAGEAPVDPDVDVEEECDPEDVAEFVMAVYMRMAHPQRGALAPILSQPFCAEDPCTKTAEELEFGSFDFDTSELDDKKYGLGYDLWVLNCLGEGKAGPVTFYIEPEGGL
jgi:hypothetical protein